VWLGKVYGCAACVLQATYNGSIGGSAAGLRFFNVTSFPAWIRYGVGALNSDQQTVSAFFNRPATIMIDHFDLLMHRRCDKAVLDFLSDLADESVRTNKFNVLLVVSSWERAIQLRDAGRCTVVGSPSRWTEEELKTVFCTPIPNWNAASKSTLFQLSVLAGSPGYLALALAGKECLFRGHAMEIDLEWRKAPLRWCMGIGRWVWAGFPTLMACFMSVIMFDLILFIIHIGNAQKPNDRACDDEVDLLVVIFSHRQ
jgi:hypothetical protein